jgi:riboflavin synthase
MFTGIVAGTVELKSSQSAPQGRRMMFEFQPSVANDLAQGASVAINGVCLTVVQQEGGLIGFDLAGETLQRTSLGHLKEGSCANYELPLALGDRLDGHLVQGHVDGVGLVKSLASLGDDWWLEVEVPAELQQQMIFKGSITVDGISLTVARLEPTFFACTIIPHTRAITNLVQIRAGDRVNLEVDMVGKWVRRLVEQNLAGLDATR